MRAEKGRLQRSEEGAACPVAIATRMWGLGCVWLKGRGGEGASERKERDWGGGPYGGEREEGFDAGMYRRLGCP